MTGTLYLVPTPLDFGCLPDGSAAAPLTDTLPEATLRAAA
ncbi:MAG TPA: ribosomal RNA small subunit methyltransferase I, partial [Comamonadaceae bacterium]|nr:ribosomal RNA small subunit methyltransferase I [Comamonadaceae bacterium]